MKGEEFPYVQLADDFWRLSWERLPSSGTAADTGRRGKGEEGLWGDLAEVTCSHGVAGGVHRDVWHVLCNPLQRSHTDRSASG